MRSDTRIQLIALALALLALLGSSLVTTAVSAEAGRAQLGYADRAEDSDPPEVAVGIALGAFRGLFVNLLWLRAEKLKQEGKFFESMELAKTITRLQPRFPRVWSFQAWNMAYNISVATKTPQERWQWVKAGIDLLRKEGIPKNPNDTLIHKELAWIFNHKIQAYADDANWYYKQRVAEEWTIALGKPPPRDGTREQSTLSYALWLEAIADAPDTLDDAIARVPAVATLVERIKTEARLPLDEKLLKAFEIELSHRESWAASAGLVSLNDAWNNPALSALLDDESLRPAWLALIGHLRKRLIIDECHMELPRMIRYTKKCGPLDWRHPSTHAMYWALRGVELGQERRNAEDFDLTNTDRIVLHAAQELARWGDLSYDILADDSYVQLPSADFMPLYGMLLKMELRQRARFFEQEHRPGTLYGMGYENFLRDAVRFFYRSGDKEKSREYFEELKTYTGFDMNRKQDLEESLSKSLDEFVIEDVQERIDSPYVAIAEFDGALQSAFMALVRGNRKSFDDQTAYAKSVHNAYMTMQLRRTTTAGKDRERAELFDRNFEFAVADSFAGMITRRRFGLYDAAIAYRRSPLWLQQPAYERLLRAAGQQFKSDSDKADFDRWYPVPENYPEYLARVEQMRREEDDRVRKGQVEVEQR